jgi:hypothetical protein
MQDRSTPAEQERQIADAERRQEELDMERQMSPEALYWKQKEDAQYAELQKERDRMVQAEVAEAQARWMPPANNPGAMSPREQWAAGLWR